MNKRDSNIRSLHEKLRSVFQRAKMPTNPATAAKILSLVNKPNSTAGQFADVIKTDAALTVRLMRMGNSVHFATRNPVTTIQRAVTVLGLRRIRMAAVSFQLVSHLDRLGKVPFDLTTFWQKSVLRACLAREMAMKVAPGLAEEAFLVGLLQDTGILLLVQILGKEYAEAYRQGDLSPTAFYDVEQKKFKYNHVEVIEAMSREWKLPEQVARPIASHHKVVRLGCKTNEVDRLCAISYFVGSVPMKDEQDSTSSNPRLIEYAERELKISAEDLDEVFANAARAYQEVAELFQDVLPEDIDVTDLLQEANRQLSLAASDNDQRVREAEVQQYQYLEERQTLQSAVAQYREKAARDPLTGLLNRGALMESFFTCADEARRSNRPISVFFLDIDNFKRLNDEFGHPVGDEVLKRVAGVLAENVRNAGLVGRYGGEEFVMVIPGLDPQAAQRQGELIVDAVRTADYSGMPMTQPVTCSVGAAWCTANPDIEAMLRMSDELMYEAKRAGKDRCVFGAEGERHDAPPSETDDPTSADDSARSIPGMVNLARLCHVAGKMNEREPADCVDSRKQKRRLVSQPCLLSFVKGPDLSLGREEACVRTVSMGGMGLLCINPRQRGDLVEVAMTNDEQKLYAVGLVAFCRHIEGEIYELGLQLFNHDKKPIISENPRDAVEQTDWMSRVIEERFGDDESYRRSA